VAVVDVNLLSHAHKKGARIKGAPRLNLTQLLRRLLIAI